MGKSPNIKNADESPALWGEVVKAQPVAISGRRPAEDGTVETNAHRRDTARGCRSQVATTAKKVTL
ncbi:Putative uncharacterized protein [Halomonas sp. R57-5]|nr:Putative uncharacterized protein [Halomonas sp. R57-5]